MLRKRLPRYLHRMGGIKILMNSLPQLHRQRQESLPVPRMRRIHRPTVHIAADHIAPSFLALDQRIVILLTDALAVVDVEEELRVALVWGFVVDHCCAGMVPVVSDQETSAALASVSIANERLVPSAVRAAPSSITVETVIGGCRACLPVSPTCDFLPRIYGRAQ